MTTLTRVTKEKRAAIIRRKVYASLAMQSSASAEAISRRTFIPCLEVHACLDYWVKKGKAVKEYVANTTVYRKVPANGG